MRHFLSLFILLFTLSLTSTAQNAKQGEWCATDQFLQEWLDANPEEAELFRKNQRELGTQPLALPKGSQTTKAPTITIPVVVHVIHWNGVGNISKAQVEDGIRVLNEDFQKLNADTSATRATYRPLAADAQIEFKLAKIDPNNNCTEGIVRINSFSTFNAGNNVKSLSGPTAGGWVASKYLNVWLVNSIGSTAQGTILGFAQFPGSGSLNTYGTVIINSQWGTIGTAANADGRTATHEIGHMFDLLHTFQGACGSNCVNTGDFICDTPPVSGPSFNCATANNTCLNDAVGGSFANPNPYSTNVPDMIENYMSYNSCQNIFTEGQKTRMLNALNFFTHLVNLKSATNLAATGTNSTHIPQQCAPIADMLLEKQFICQGSSVSFSETSYGGPITTYNWGFPGGTPSTSSSATPNVTYNTPGTYDVILRVSNSTGGDTLVLQDVIVVGDTTQAISAFAYVEGFENANSIGTNWTVFDPTGGVRWDRAPIGFSGNFSAFLFNNGSPSGQNDILMSPLIDMTSVISPIFQFKLAYRSRTAASNDQFRFAVSIDCGKTWTNSMVLTSSFMTNGFTTTNYIPAQADWLTFNIPTNAAIRNSKNLRVRFDFTSGGGNNIFIDDFKILGQPVGIEEQKLLESSFLIFPNPTNSGSTGIQFLPEEELTQASLYVSNILGAKVQEIYNGPLSKTEYKFNVNTSGYSPGIYFVTLQSEAGRITKKLVVN